MRIRAALGMLCGAALLVLALQYVIVGRMEAAWRGMQETAAEGGLRLDGGVRAVPFGIAIDEARLAPLPGDGVLSAPRLRLAPAPLDGFRPTLAAPGKLEFVAHPGATPIRIWARRLTIARAPGAAWRLRASDLGAGPAGSGPDDLAAISELRADAGPVAGGWHEAATARGIVLPARAARASPLRTVERISVALTLATDRRTLRLGQADLAWGGLFLKLAGTLRADDAGRLQGEGSAAFGPGWAGALARCADGGAIDPGVALALAGLLGLFAPDDTVPVAVPLHLQDGRLMLGPSVLLALPALAPPWRPAR